MKNKFISIFKEFLKFGIVGISSAAIWLFIYYVLIFFEIHFLIANSVSVLISVLNTYYWNRKYVFTKSKSKKSSQIFKVYVSYGISFLITNLLMYILVDIFIISTLLAPVITLCVTVPLNFLLGKFWAFK